LNKCPTKKIKNQVPKQVRSRRKSSVAHLKIVGSLWCKGIPYVIKKKLEDKSEPMIIVGYHKTWSIQTTQPVSNEHWDWKTNEYNVSTKNIVIEESHTNKELTITKSSEWRSELRWRSKHQCRVTETNWFL